MNDIIVIGGGPAGCHTAALLAERGFEVQLFEEHPVIGQPVDCAGVIGSEAFEALSLPNSLQLGKIDAIRFVSPSELELRVALREPMARIIDRGALDRTIAQRASAAGANIHLAARVTGLTIGEDRIVAQVCSTANHWSPGAEVRRIEARIAILASGPRYHVQCSLGMGRPNDFLKTAQVEAPIRGIDETVVFVGSRFAPGSFAWVIPFQRDHQSLARIGVSGKVAAHPYLRRLLRYMRDRGHLESTDFRARSWVIPVAPIARSYSNRALAVGDAAGQTKPTTGGGIYYGICSAHSAAYAVATAFARSDFSSQCLARYERQWWQILGEEIRSGMLFRRVSERLTDPEMDYIFRVARSNGMLAAAARKLRFDWHRDLIAFALKHPLLGRIAQREHHAKTNSYDL